MEIIIDATGWIGAVLVLYGYLMVSTNRLEGSSLHYQGANIAGAFCLMINTYFHHAYPSAIVNVIWIVIGFYSLQSSKKHTEA
jgi:hypothetical protein